MCSVYQMSEEAAAEDEDGEDNVPSYREWELPSATLDTVRAWLHINEVWQGFGWMVMNFATRSRSFTAMLLTLSSQD